MASLRLMAVPTLVLAAALVGCDSDNKTATSESILKDNETLTKQLADSNDKLNAMGEQLASAQKRADDLQAQLANCQGATPVAAAGAGHAAVDTKDFANIDGVDVTVEGNDIHLTIANSLLFDSGKTGLKDSARRTLDTIAQRVKEKYPSRELIVIGHTDSDPIRKSSFPTNYHLGFERAFAVREYLGKKGIAENHVALMSYGPDMPETTKEKSRRVEVVVTGGDAVTAAKTEAPKNAPAAAGKAPAKKSAPAKAASTKATGTKATGTSSSK